MIGVYFIILCGVLYPTLAAPAPKDENEFLPPIYFKDGTVGVNFLGFKASAGLGGLLTGDASHGGLHAEAETPFGQKAGAGLGGIVDENGRSAGGLYAGATAGGGIGAMAGLDGSTYEDGSIGRSYAGASAGGKTVIKERVSAPAVGASLTSSFNIQKVPPPPATIVVKEKTILPESQVKIELDKAPAVKTYVERTVIPNYVEKTIQVPSYVEKTIRVPTVVEKKVKVPAPPTIIEKEVEIPQPVRTVVKTKHIEEVPVGGVTTVYKTKTKVHRRPWLRKHISINSGEVPYYGGVVADAAVAGDQPVTYTKTVRKQFNGDLIRDIFNIPISTLNAVGNLVGNVAAGTSGSVSVSKSYGAAY